MSSRQFGALSSRFERRQQREDLLVGIMASATANFGFYAPKDTMLQPWDFVRSLKPPPEPEQSDEDIAAQINAILMPRAVLAPTA
jgi:hypothetical protein